jgi:hypothetical protein
LTNAEIRNSYCFNKGVPVAHRQVRVKRTHDITSVRTMRPSESEEREARAVLDEMRAAGIVHKKAVRSDVATIACVLALQAGERFKSDKHAKRSFGVHPGTNVRKRWLPRYLELVKWRRERQCTEIERTGDVPDVVASHAAVAVHMRTFRCKHQPVCASECIHVKRCRANKALRQERWRSKLQATRQPSEPLPGEPLDAPSPESSEHQMQSVMSMRRAAGARRCQGTTRLGQPCQVDSHHGINDAAPLRAGSDFCAHHQPDKFTGTQCEGTTKQRAGCDERRCRVFSGSLYSAAVPLRNGKRFCAKHQQQACPLVRCIGKLQLGHGRQCRVTSRHSFEDVGAPLREGSRFCTMHRLQQHEFVQCAALTAAGRCLITSWHAHDGAQPLRDGERFCATHEASLVAHELDVVYTHPLLLPDGTVCASCQSGQRLREDASDGGVWYCQSCWDAWEHDDPLRDVWGTLLAGVY